MSSYQIRLKSFWKLWILFAKTTTKTFDGSDPGYEKIFFFFLFFVGVFPRLFHSMIKLLPFLLVQPGDLILTNLSVFILVTSWSPSIFLSTFISFACNISLVFYVSALAFSAYVIVGCTVALYIFYFGPHKYNLCVHVTGTGQQEVKDSLMEWCKVGACALVPPR